MESLAVVFGLLLVVTVASGQVVSAGDTPTHHQSDVFKFGDKNNDSALSMAECQDTWMNFDVDKDLVISKMEFFVKWRFSNLDDATHAPVFFRLIDVDFDGHITPDEVTKLCHFFDDDEDGKIDMFEFDLTWEGLFNFVN